jgi:1-acyl-sn-glycerol-3-phosphate acyltransferase
MLASLRAVLRLAAISLLTIVLLPVQVVVVNLGPRRAEVIPRFYHRTVARLLGFTLASRGEMRTVRPTLFVSNHTSYLDIIVLGGLILGSFVSKAEVRGWPLIGWLARLHRTVFIGRQRSATAGERDNLALRLQAADNLILFPEGTSNDGNRTLNFKSALFAIANPGAGVGASSPPVPDLTVQPVSLAYSGLDGMPLGRAKRPLYAWYGDMDLAGHLWQVARQGWATIDVTFHEPVAVEAFSDRKSLAAHCQRVVAAGVTAALTGRQTAPLSRKRRRRLRLGGRGRAIQTS